MTVWLFVTVAIAMFMSGVLIAILLTSKGTDNKVRFFENAKDRDGTIFMFMCFVAVLLLVYWFQEHVDEATLSFILGNLVNGFILVGKSAIDAKINGGHST